MVTDVARRDVFSSLNHSSSCFVIYRYISTDVPRCKMSLSAFRMRISRKKIANPSLTEFLTWV